MNAPTHTNRSKPWEIALVIIAAAASYANSLSCPFVFDANSAIVENPTIRSLRVGLFPPLGGSPVSGRPLVNLSFAANYAWGGLDVFGYHVVNVLIHALAGLTLLGVVRRSTDLLMARPTGHPEIHKWWGELTAPAVAVLWTVHPLQTASVTYVVQRAESLAGLFYFLTLYLFIRGSACTRPSGIKWWYGFSVAACLAGMGTKEVMVTAPLIILLFDRMFFVSSFADAFRARKIYYAGLAACWILVLWLFYSNGVRGGTVGFATSIAWTAYAKSQVAACVLYLWLSIWPHPLLLDYGLSWGVHSANLGLDAILLGSLLGASILAVARNWSVGFLGAWYFVILAPSSSIIPIATEVVAEHRMYLPLASVILCVVLLLHRLLGRAELVAYTFLGVACIWTTVKRNDDYRDEVTLWSKTIANVPENSRAHDYLGQAMAGTGDYAGAAHEFAAAIAVDPRLPGPPNNLGFLLLKHGRTEDAIRVLQDVVLHFPNFPPGRMNLAHALMRVGQNEEATMNLREAVRLRPDDATNHAELAASLQSQSRWDEALQEYHEALRLDPDSADFHFALGNLLAARGRAGEAATEYQASLRIDPNSPQTEANLGTALLELGRTPEALFRLSEALRGDPQMPEAQMEMGNALLRSGQTKNAVGHYQAALALKPDFAGAHYNLGVALQRLGQTERARDEFEIARKLQTHP